MLLEDDLCLLFDLFEELLALDALLPLLALEELLALDELLALELLLGVLFEAFELLLVTDLPPLLDFALLDDLLELADLGDLAALLSSLDSSERFLSEESAESRVPLATENARNVAINTTPLNTKKAFALNLAKPPCELLPPPLEDLYPLPLEPDDEEELPPELPSHGCPKVFPR